MMSLGGLNVFEISMIFYQVLLENQNVDLPGIQLGKPEKDLCIAEKVLAVAHNVRTNYSSNSVLVVTTYR